MLDLSGKNILVTGYHELSEHDIKKGIAPGIVEAFLPKLIDAGANAVVTYNSREPSQLMRDAYGDKVEFAKFNALNEEDYKTLMEIILPRGEINGIVHAIMGMPGMTAKARQVALSLGKLREKNPAERKLSDYDILGRIDYGDFLKESIDLSVTSLEKIYAGLKENGKLAPFASIIAFSLPNHGEMINYAASSFVKQELEDTFKDYAANNREKTRWNIVRPGAWKSPSSQSYPFIDDYLAEAQKTSPLHLPTDPNRIANYIIFLLNDDSKEMTGNVIDLDAGARFKYKDIFASLKEKEDRIFVKPKNNGNNK